MERTAGGGLNSETILIRKYTDSDLETVLELIGRSDSTNRTKETWAGNNMTAMLAFEEEKLIGIIPFEKRKIVLDQNTKIDALWVSAAHVESKYRSQGVGTRLDHAIKDEFFPEFEAVFVIREDEQSAAYRWYKKLGYQKQVPIISFRHHVQLPTFRAPEYVVWETREQILNGGEKLFECFKKNIGDRGGFQERNAQFWANKWETHYYEFFYRYYVVVIASENEVISYAMLGETKMKDGIARFDILEIMGAEDESAKKDIYSAIMGFARELNLQEVRIQIVERDEDAQWVQSFGFVERWRTNILGKRIMSSDALPSIHWQYFHIDYI